jgi:hypothetical protein
VLPKGLAGANARSHAVMIAGWGTSVSAGR